MYFNQDLFEKAGISEKATPDDVWEWDRFVHMAEATTKKEGGRTRQYGYIQDTR